MFSKILVAYDGSDHARKALETGAGLAKTHGAELHLCHIHDFGTPAIVVGAMVAPLDVPRGREDIENASATTVEEAKSAAEAIGVPITQVYLGAMEPARVILNTADQMNADLIVMGRRGLGSFGALALGSVSQSVSHSATCACMTVL